MQPFLRKCFDALVKLEFGTGNKSTDILAMISPKGERVGLGRNLKARGPVEEWLKARAHSHASAPAQNVCTRTASASASVLRLVVTEHTHTHSNHPIVYNILQRTVVAMSR